jgi:putative transposase
MFPTEHPEFVTATCLNWKNVLAHDGQKRIVADSLRFLVLDQRIILYAFVIMSNHMHAIWQVMGKHKSYEVLRDFLKYTGQQLFAEVNPSLYNELLVNAGDRRYQVWKRNTLRIPLWSEKVFNQKLNYIHLNPVKAGLCQDPEEYRFSSASFYYLDKSEWDFLTHSQD